MGTSAHKLTLRLTGFSCDELAQQAAREHVPLERLLSLAVLYYSSDSGDRAAAALPRFKRAPPEGEHLEVTLDVDSEAWGAVEEQARRQHVSTERILEHAALYYLADLHSGRLPSRLANASSPNGRPPREVL